MKILIKNLRELYTGDKIIDNAYLIIEGKKITALGPMASLTEKEGEFERVINGQGRLALPGLINTHTHASMTLLRGYADDLPLQKWLEEKIWPFEAKLSGEDIYWGALLAILEMIKTGTTTFADMYFQMDRVGEAVATSGIRAVLSQGLIEAHDGKAGLEDALRFSLDWQGKAGGRITTMLAPHAPYTCSQEYLEEIAALAHQHQLPIHIHLAETKLEYTESLKKKGVSPTKYLAEIGLFQLPVLAAHCVYVDEEDLCLLAENRVGVAYNPSSNMKLGSGIAPVSKMLEYGITVGLGTDGVASNNNLDLLQEARLGSYLQKVNELKPTSLNIKEMLDILTINGARILQLQDLGSIEVGNLADIILVDLSQESHYYPHHNNLSNFLYAGSGRDVVTVIIDGEIIMDEGEVLTLDEERIYYQVEKIVGTN